MRRLTTFHLELAPPYAALPAAIAAGFLFPFKRPRPVRARSRAPAPAPRRASENHDNGREAAAKCGLQLPAFRVKRYERPH